ncbi:TniQ family protein [Mycolicibacterium sp. YH-1]|uniref:TniQ family protein n=1 Tax=Mycolicibacterium sp. YH-1 TaxID=2908837 RepID=UPI001F4C1252|nr:LysR family transcriptional regulator [Mycolicibacterium sp. YH-1]UNB52868.1 LysR family transcriptional regulator [Mycolicibacterium sp. YH-1]
MPTYPRQNSPDRVASWGHAWAPRAGDTMAPTVRSLPVHLNPVDGEALDSWLEALCRQLRCTWGDFTGAVGLPPPPQGIRTPTWLIRLTPTEARALHVATGTPTQALHAMTLASLDGAGLGLAPGTCALDRSFPWSRFRFSRYCPQCLRGNGGRWQLFWRSGWAFACVEHCCLLIDECPACGHRLRGHVGHSELVPYGQRCSNAAAHARGRAPQRCGVNLAAVPAVRLGQGHPTIAAQHLIRQVIDSGAATFGIYHDNTVPAADALADIRAVAARILASATAEDWRRVLPADLAAAYAEAHTPGSAVGHEPKSGRAAPVRAVTAAAGVTAALGILDVAGVAAAARAMQWLIDSREQGRKVDRVAVATWGKGTTETLTAAQLVACGPCGFRNTELRYRAGTPLPTRPVHDTNNATVLAARVPALMWPAFALRLTAPRQNFPRMSAGLAAAALLVNSRVSYEEAIGLLGGHLTTHALSYVLRRLHSGPCWNDTRRAVIVVADYLHTHDCPIDYQRRRTLDYTALLPAATWRDICAVSRIVCTGASLHLTRAHLYAVLSGNPVQHAPSYLDTPSFAEAVLAYPARLTPAAAAALQTVAREFLQRAGIAEPLTWQPPLRLLDGLVLPGADPDTIDIPTLHHLIEHRETLRAAARQLHTTPETVRHVLTLHPAHAGPPPTVPALSALAAALPPETFAALYRQERMRLRDIAARYHAAHQTVSDLAHQYGIDTPCGGPRSHQEIDRDWLRTEYVVHRRTLPDLAAEKGMTAPTMSLCAQRHGIARRPPGFASTAANVKAARQTEHAPAPLRPALIPVGGAARLDRFEKVLRYSTITAAATDLGLHQSALTSQIARLEADLGAALIERAQRGRPMTLTPHGARVLRAWKAWKRST